ncbi:MAG: hypothetical protein V4721_06705 [Bacteroidota bacterium]
MITSITVLYEDCVPRELIAEFKRSCIESELNLTVQTKKNKKEEHHNFVEDEIYNIFIYLNEHKSHIIDSVLGRVAFELLKAPFVKLFQGLKKSLFNNQPSETKLERDITIRVSNGEKEIELSFKSNVDERLIETLYNKAIEHITDENLEKAFSTKDYVSTKDDKPRIRLVYNEKEGTWGWYDFNKIKRYIDSKRHDVNQNILD